MSHDRGGPVLMALRRSGGLAGIALARTVDVEDLSEDDAAQWRALLGDDALRGLTGPASRRTIPDAYSYHLACPPDADELTLAEHDLPEPVRDLFERTLQA